MVPAGAALVAHSGHHLDAGDFFAEQEPDGVGLVHDGVPDHELGIEVIANGGDSVGAMHLQDVAESAAADELLQSHVLGVESAHEPHLDEAPAQFGFRLDELVGGVDVGGEWLLAEDRNAAVETGRHLLEVGVTGRRQQHGVDVGVVDRVDGIGDDAGPEPVGHLGGLLRDEVVDDRDGGSLDGCGEHIDVIAAHQAEAQDGDAKVAHRVASSPRFRRRWWWVVRSLS